MKKHRIISAIIVAVMIFSMVPASAATLASNYGDVLNGSIVLMPGCPFAIVNGTKTSIAEKYDALAVEKIDGKAYVPASFIAKALNCTVSWDNLNRTVVLNTGAVKIEAPVGNTSVMIDGKATTWDAAVLIRNDRAMIPVYRFFTALGRKITAHSKGMIIIHPEVYIAEPSSAVSAKLYTFFDENIQTVNLYVSKDGSGNNDGSEDFPFYTVEQAKEAAKQLIADEKSVVVNISEGDYFVSSPLTFKYEDSGLGLNTVTYKANGKVRIFGGERIVGWEDQGNGIYKVNVGKNFDVSTLNEGGAKAVLARFPDEGSFAAGTIDSNSKSTFIYNEDLPAVKDYSEVNVVVNNNSNNAIYKSTKVLKVDTTNKTIQTENAVIEEGTRYYLSGAKEYLSQPGEYYYENSTGALYYIPRGNIEKAVLTTGTVDNILRFEAQSIGLPVANITFEGIEFISSKSDAIYISTARNITFNKCKISNTGRCGVYMAANSFSNKVKNSEITATGHSAVYIGSIDNAYKTASDITSSFNNKYNEVINCELYDGGYTNVKGGAVVISNSGENTVMHNSIHGYPRYGVALLAPARNVLVSTIKTINDVKVTDSNYRNYVYTRYNKIGYNDIFNCMTSNASVGVIEVFGAQPKNIIINNYIHDISTYNAAYSGINLNTAADEVIIKNNVIKNLKNTLKDTTNNNVYAYGISYKGKSNIVSNNILADFEGLEAGVFFGKDANETTNTITFTKNVMYNVGDVLYRAASWNNGNVKTINNNAVYNSEGKYIVKGVSGATDIYGFKTINNGVFDTNTIVEDPRFADIHQNNFEREADSQLSTVGIETINIAEAGLTLDYPVIGEQEISNFYVNNTDGKIEGSAIALMLNESFRFSAIEVYKESGIKDYADLKVTSDNTSVVTVNGTTIKGIKKGIANVTVSVHDKSFTYKVYVDEQAVDFKMYVDLPYIANKKSKVINYYITTDLGRKVVKGVETEFSSSERKTLSVDKNGKMTASSTRTGPVTVMCKATYKGKTITSTLDVEVKYKLLRAITATTSKNLIVGKTSKISVSASYTTNTKVNMQYVNLSYEVNDPSIATVDDKGYITTHKEGDLIVTVYGELDGVVCKSTLTPSILLKPKSAYDYHWAAEYDSGWVGSIKTHANGFKYTGGMQNGTNMVYQMIDFGNNGPMEMMFEYAVSPEQAGGTITVRLGSTSGRVIGKAVISSTGSYENYGKIYIPITGEVKGVQNVALVFNGGAGICNAKAFRFTEKQ